LKFWLLRKKVEKFIGLSLSTRDDASQRDWPAQKSQLRNIIFELRLFGRKLQHQTQQNMARRRTKKRTHVGANNGPANKVLANQSRRDPKSMIIRIGAGEVGPSVSQLVKDVRAMMEPGTASRLKERRNNRLKDYLTMAGPLGVSHLLLFSRSESGNTNLRLALTPRGPTLHFQIEKYSLCKDIRKALKHPKGGGKESLSPPLVRPLWLGVALG
jgi:hypothetical protein